MSYKYIHYLTFSLEENGVKLLNTEYLTNIKDEFLLNNSDIWRADSSRLNPLTDTVFLYSEVYDISVEDIINKFTTSIQQLNLPYKITVSIYSKKFINMNSNKNTTPIYKYNGCVNNTFKV